MTNKLLLSALLVCGGLLTSCGGSGGTSTPPAVTNTVPNPSNPSAAVSSASPTTITLSWNAVSGATSYKVDRDNGSGFTEIATVTTPSYTDSNLPTGSYTYRVRTVTAAGVSSGATSAAISIQGAATQAPANATSVTATVQSAAVAVTWPAVAGATSYTVERSINGGTYTQVATPTQPYYYDASLKDGTYRYRIKSVNSIGTSTGTESNTVTYAATTAPEAPLFVTAFSISGRIDVSWASSTGATQYKVERMAAGGAYSTVATTAATTYTDSGLPEGEYTYRVSAINSYGTSSPTVSKTAFSGNENKYKSNKLLGTWLLNYTDTTSHSLTVTFTSGEQYDAVTYRVVGQDSNGTIFRGTYNTTTSKYVIGGSFGTPQEIYFTFDTINADGSINGVYWLNSTPKTQPPFSGKKTS